MRALFQDIRYGLRMMAKNPAFTFFVVAVLALGIAGNTAIFSVANAVLVRPLPYRQADRLVMVWKTLHRMGFRAIRPRPEISPIGKRATRYLKIWPRHLSAVRSTSPAKEIPKRFPEIS